MRTSAGRDQREQRPAGVTTNPDAADFSLTDDELRASHRLKWSTYPPDVLPAWVADMDVRPAETIVRALQQAVALGRTTYPPLPHGSGVPEAFAAFHARRHGWAPDPARVVLAGDVMGGLELVLGALADPGPVAVPVPNYGPFFHLVRHLGREIRTIPHVLDGAGRLTLDLDVLESEFRSGTRCLLVSQPQNPLGRAFDRAELGALVELASKHGARIVSDEIWGCLTHDPSAYLPLASVPGAEGVVTAVTSSAKAWNIAGLKSAVMVTTSGADQRTLGGLPVAANHGTSSLGLVAALAAYEQGEAWLDSLLLHLRSVRERLERLLAVRLPGVTMPRTDATFLAWLDTSALGLADPVRSALTGGRVALSPGTHFWPGGAQHGPQGDPAGARSVRLNYGTSVERLERIIDGLARAWLR